MPKKNRSKKQKKDELQKIETALEIIRQDEIGSVTHLKDTELFTVDKEGHINSRSNLRKRKYLPDSFYQDSDEEDLDAIRKKQKLEQAKVVQKISKEQAKRDYLLKQQQILKRKQQRKGKKPQESTPAETSSSIATKTSSSPKSSKKEEKLVDIWSQPFDPVSEGYEPAKDARGFPASVLLRPKVKKDEKMREIGSSQTRRTQLPSSLYFASSSAVSFNPDPEKLESYLQELETRLEEENKEKERMRRKLQGLDSESEEESEIKEESKQPQQEEEEESSEEEEEDEEESKKPSQPSRKTQAQRQKERQTKLEQKQKKQEKRRKELEKQILNIRSILKEIKKETAAKEAKAAEEAAREAEEAQDFNKTKKKPASFGPYRYKDEEVFPAFVLKEEIEERQNPSSLREAKPETVSVLKDSFQRFQERGLIEKRIKHDLKPRYKRRSVTKPGYKDSEVFGDQW